MKTFKEAFDFTFQRKWKRQASAKITKINGRKIPGSTSLEEMGKSRFWIDLISDLEDQGLSNSTIKRVLATASTAMKFTFMAGEHSVTIPPFERPKAGEARLAYLSKDDVDRVVEASPKPLADAVLFAAYTGVRRAELLQLKSSDIDWNLNKIWVGGVAGRETKGKEVRALPIHEKIADLLKERMDREFVFADDWSHSDKLTREFQKVINTLGLSGDLNWHSLRHSFGTWLGAVCQPRTIMALMGHANIETSLRYVKATDKASEAAILSI